MAEWQAALRTQLVRQVQHWLAAVEGLGDLGRFASPAAWGALERYLGATIQHELRDAVERLAGTGRVVQARLAAAGTLAELEAVRAELLRLRRHYLTVETMLDFYGDAVNTRTNGQVATLLQACDHLARQSLREFLEPLGLTAPPILTYLDKGLGASILKAGLRLWDGRSMSPVAAVKLVRHNLVRPTSLIHETGHQAAHQVDWLEELAAALQRAAGGDELGRLWAGWASEIAADAFAFVHTGYAALAALHDVLADENETVLRLEPLDPHPSGYVRILLGHQMCQRCFGAGPWDDLAAAWTRAYPLEDADADAAALFRRSTAAMPALVEAILFGRYRAFRGQRLVDVLDPARVKPEALVGLERAAGGALYTSSDWIRREALRLLALAGYEVAASPHSASAVLRRQQLWMQKLGEDSRGGVPQETHTCYAR